MTKDFSNYPNSYTTTMKELNNYLNHELCGNSVLRVNWTRIFEAEVPIQGEVSGDFEIKIKYPQLVCDTLQFMAALDNR